MTDNDHLRLKGATRAGEPLLSENLEVNLYSFLSWGLLGIGHFSTVTIPCSGAYGGDFHRLRPLADPNYTDGQLWQAARQDWVWETGVLHSTQPIRVSGVNVGGTFYPVGTTGAMAFSVDYPHGRVIFENAQSTSAVVTCEYSYRHFHLSTADVPWWREVQFDSYRVDDDHFLKLGSGTWSALSQARAQLPCVIIEAVPYTRRQPFGMGHGAATVTQDVLCHIFAETRWDKKQLHDILTMQWQKRLRGFDVGSLLASGLMPLDENGSPTGSGGMYPDWVSQHSWKQIRITNTSSNDQPGAPPLYYCTVRLSCEVDLA